MNTLLNQDNEFDSLFNGQEQEQAADDFDVEAYKEFKREEREKLNSMIDEMTEVTFSDPEALESYLNMQSKTGRMGVTNTLLVLSQNPKATFVADYGSWTEKGRFLKKGEGKNPIRIIRADGEYVREDGKMATSYKIDKLYDISQTHGKSISQRSSLSMPLRSKLKALTTDTPVKIQLSDNVSKETAAIYSKSENMISVARGTQGETMFFAISRELARSQNFTGDIAVDTFVSSCTANIVCRRFGISPYSVDIPENVADMGLREQRSVLSTVNHAANEINERVDLNLNIERNQQRNQPAR